MLISVRGLVQLEKENSKDSPSSFLHSWGKFEILVQGSHEKLLDVAIFDFLQEPHGRHIKPKENDQDLPGPVFIYFAHILDSRHVPGYASARAHQHTKTCPRVFQPHSGNAGVYFGCFLPFPTSRFLLPLTYHDSFYPISTGRSGILGQWFESD